MKAFEAQEEERSLLKQKIKAVTFSKGKAPPPKDRDIMAYDHRGEKHQKSLQRNLDVLKARLAEIEANPLSNPKPKSIKGLRFLPTPLASSVAIELEQVSKAFGEKVHKAAIGGAELLSRLFSTLSVGQRKRLMLLSLILEKPNVLLPDEPTNHLDFLTPEAFETALLNFEGAILAISHDSTFIEKPATQEWSLDAVS